MRRIEKIIKNIRNLSGDNINFKNRDQKLMRLNRILSNRKNVKNMIITMDVLLILIFNYIFNSFRLLLSGATIFDNVWGIVNFFNPMGFFRWPILYLLLFAFIAVCDFWLIYRIRTAFSEENFNVEQKGSSCFTTLEELKEQYRQIDEVEGEYDGLPGMLISTYGGKHFIDDGNTNTYVIGITRAGKDEIFVQPSINDYSRSKQRPSIVTIDIKGESYRSSKDTLESRGYKVLLYNLSDPEHSISVNYLSNIYYLYKIGEYDTAENLAYAFSVSLFASEADDSKNAFFWTNAASLLCALILAVVEDNMKKDREYNERKKEDSSDRDNYKNEYPHEKYVNLYNVIVTFSELSRKKDLETGETELDRFFNKREATDRAKLKYLSVEISSDRAKGDIYATMATKLAPFMQESIAKASLKSDFDMVDIGFGEQPLAIFIMLPDYENSLHVLASNFIMQSYYMLSKACDVHFRCKRPVKYILNEFGNMPKIQNMANIITVCLGRNITFDLYIQSIERIRTLYGRDATTILGNCGNQIYLLANDIETAEYFSKVIGNKTIIDIQRTGEKMSLNKTYMERSEKLPLLDPNELLELKPGHCVIRRAMKRIDLKGNSIRPRPIYNNDEDGTTLKYRHTYLSNVMKDPNTVPMHSVEPPKVVVGNLSDYVFIPDMEKNGELFMTDIPLEVYEKIKDYIDKGAVEYEDRDILKKNMSLNKLQDFIEHYEKGNKEYKRLTLKEIRRELTRDMS